MPNILVEKKDAIVTITLNRPEKLNSFAGNMREELIEVLRQTAYDGETTAVVLTGTGRAFCAGGDIDYMLKLQKERATPDFCKLLDAGKAIVTTIRAMPQIVIAAINGVAAGAGCNLALAADYRIAAESAKLAETFVRIGLHPDWGGTWLLPHLIGPSRALELMATGRMVEADEALRIGMVDRVVPDAKLMDETMSLAKSIAAGPRVALRGMKHAVYASPINDLASQIDLEGRHQVEAFLSEDAAEGMNAFFEKRKPKFQGR